MAGKIKRRVLEGEVVSDRMDKTIVVKVWKMKKHPLYGKTMRIFKKYKAHDQNNEAKEGDKVRIIETRPLSRQKRYRLVEIIEKRSEL